MCIRYLAINACIISDTMYFKVLVKAAHLFIFLY